MRLITSFLVWLALCVGAHAQGLDLGMSGTPCSGTYGYVDTQTSTLTVPSGCKTAVMAIWSPGTFGSAGITTRGGSGGASGDYDQAGTFGSSVNPVTGLTPGQTLYVTIVARQNGGENCVSSAAGCTGTVYVHGTGGAGNAAPTDAGNCSIANCTTIIGLSGGASVAAGAGGGGSSPGGPGATVALKGGAAVGSDTGGAGGAGAYGTAATPGNAPTGASGAAGGEGFAGTGAGAGGTGALGSNGTVGSGGGGGTNKGGNGAQYFYATTQYPSVLNIGPGGGGGGGGNDLGVAAGGGGGAGGVCGSGGGGGGGGTSGGAAGLGGTGCVLISFGPGIFASNPPQTQFQHVVLVIQENRTPDNFFQGLCSPSSKCSITPGAGQYNIQTTNWKDNTSPGGVRAPITEPFGVTWDLDHLTRGFNALCDKTGGVCLMDGNAATPCDIGTCPAGSAFSYVDNTAGELNPYLTLANNYGWGNYFFQTNQSYSYPAHLFLFSGTSAVSAAQDHAGTFTNGGGSGGIGCEAASGTTVPTIGPTGAAGTPVAPCGEYTTLTDLLDGRGVTWKYYGSNGPAWPDPMLHGIWVVPDSVSHICGTVTAGQCTGTEWVNNVIFTQSQVLTDISTNCTLAGVSWVNPDGDSSDHNGATTNVNGPSWVTSIVNAVGTSTCKNPDGSSYWNSTAIIIVWDDWGGVYDHEPPTFLGSPQGGFQLGFRVPAIVVSAYTPVGFISNTREDFGSILRFIEQNFGIEEGALTFADARASADMTEYFTHGIIRGYPMRDLHMRLASLETGPMPSFSQYLPRSFEPIRAPHDANYFLTKPPSTNPPDND